MVRKIQNVEMETHEYRCNNLKYVIIVIFLKLNQQPHFKISNTHTRVKAHAHMRACVYVLIQFDVCVSVHAYKYIYTYTY